jgi:hypothetical protein
MADRLSRRHARTSPVSETGNEDRLPRSPHADKFRVVLAGLSGLALGALAVAAAVLAAHDNSSSSTASASASASTLSWSTWKPSATGNAGAAQIANYIAPFYRLSTSQQLAVVTPISTTELNASTGSFTGSGLTVALKSATSNSSGSSLRPLSGQTVGFDLCGQGGPDCSVGGTSSTVRLLLLRREALELAMYTFKYLPRAQNVVAVLPPGRDSSTQGSKKLTVAVLFDRQELAPLLTEPVESTLQEYPPDDLAQLKAWKKSEEAGLVDTITGRSLFSESVEAQQDGSNLLILNPLPAQ